MLWRLHLAFSENSTQEALQDFRQDESHALKTQLLFADKVAPCRPSVYRIRSRDLAERPCAQTIYPRPMGVVHQRGWPPHARPRRVSCGRLPTHTESGTQERTKMILSCAQTIFKRKFVAAFPSLDACRSSRTRHIDSRQLHVAIPMFGREAHPNFVRC